MSAIYRAFDQATLDHQYNAQATVGDISPFIEMYTEGSAAARARLPFEEALSFGASSEETLDLFPAGDGAPLLVFIHHKRRANDRWSGYRVVCDDRPLVESEP